MHLLRPAQSKKIVEVVNMENSLDLNRLDSLLALRMGISIHRKLWAFRFEM